MKEHIAAALSACAILASPGVAADKSIKVVEPTSQWNLDFAEERCTLSRSFGEGKDAVILYIHSYGPYSGYRFMLAGSLVPRSSQPVGDIRFRFTPDTQEREKTQTVEGVSGSHQAVSFSAAIAPYMPVAAFRGMTPEGIAAFGIRMLTEAPLFEAKTDNMVVDFGNRSRAELRLGNMAAPMQAMRNCAEDLQRSWGLDPARLQKLSRVTTPSLSAGAALQRRLPDSRALRGENALIPVRIMVSAEGEATQCVVQVANIEPAFTDAVCAGLARQFAPALDEAGRPVASIFQTTVFYLARR